MKHFKTVFTIITLISGITLQANAQDNFEITLEKFADGIHHYELFAEDLEYQRLEAHDFIGLAENLVTTQNEDGGWPKNIDWLAAVNMDSLKKSLSDFDVRSTFDNDNTHPQIDFLAKMYTETRKESYRESAVNGLQYILDTQHESGGWRGWDVDAITYNDNVMVGIMEVLYDVKTEKTYYSWVNEELRHKLNEAFDRALDVTIKSQIEVNGIKTAWGQQHDHVTLDPVKGRSYELPGVVSRESVNIVDFLMQIENPEQRVITAVDAAVDWFRLAGLENIRVDTIHISPDTYPGQNLDVDRKAVTDSSAPTIWSRYYEIEDNTPFFCRRDGKKVETFGEINPERRGGYDWYGYWPADLLKNKYPAWKESMSN